MHKIDVIIGGRSELIQASVLRTAITGQEDLLEFRMIHTGEGMDPEFTPQLFEQLSFQPDEYLGIEGITGTRLFAEVLVAYEDYLQIGKPDAVMLLGNSDSSAACALAASRKGVEIIRIDAGNRHFDPKHNEEQNDGIIDRLSTTLITSNSESVINLMREGFDSEQIVELGNLRSDAVFHNLGHAEDSYVLENYDLIQGGYLLVYAGFDERLTAPANIISIFQLLENLSSKLKVHMVLSPESLLMLEDYPELDLESHDGFTIVSGHGYHDMLRLMKYAGLILTDSQSVQEESMILGVPCLTLGNTTNRPVTLAKGTNLLVGFDPGNVQAGIEGILEGNVREAFPMDTWDGKVAPRIIEYLSKKD